MQRLLTGEALRHGEQQVGVVQHPGGHQVMRRAQGDASLPAQLAKRKVHITQTVAATGYLDMPRAQVVFQGQRPGGQRMSGAHGADETVFEQLDVAHLRVAVERHVHREIQLAGGQLAGGFPAPRQGAFDAHLRRQAAETLEQRRQQQRLAEVGHADAEGLGGLGGDEGAAFLHRHPQQLERLTHRPDDVLRHGGGHHALGGAHEQRVVEGLAQARQGIGHRRLGDADDLPGAGQVGFAVDGIENDEQVEIDLARCHGGIPF